MTSAERETLRQRTFITVAERDDLLRDAALGAAVMEMKEEIQSGLGRTLPHAVLNKLLALIDKETT